MKQVLPSGRFRKQLKEELPLLSREGLITEEQALRLGQRYRLDELGAEATNHLLSVIYIVGTLLIGVGIISFVAAHWEAIPRGVKVVLLFAAMAAAHGAGFWLWQVRGTHPKLGHALVLLGTLIFGANIGLLAQIFHIRGNPYDAFLAWSVGALVMAYAVGCVPNGLVALVTAAVFYFGMTMDYQSQTPLWFPMAATLAFVPLLILLRSRWILWGLLILLAFALPIGIAETLEEPDTFPASFGLMGFVFIGAAMASRLRESTAFIEAPARIVAVASSAVGLYFAAFHGMAEDLVKDNAFHFFSLPMLDWIVVGFLAPAGLLLVVWAAAQRPSSAEIMLPACIAAAGVILILLPVWIDFFTLTLLANLAYLALCAALFHRSFREESRGAFWSAAVLLLLLIVSRTLEYETELLLKAVIFVACGVAFIVAGVLFERFLKTRRTYA